MCFSVKFRKSISTNNLATFGRRVGVWLIWASIDSVEWMIRNYKKYAAKKS